MGTIVLNKKWLSYEISTCTKCFYCTESMTCLKLRRKVSPVIPNDCPLMPVSEVKVLLEVTAGRLKKARKTAVKIRDRDAINLLDCLTEELCGEFLLIDQSFNKEEFINDVRGE